VIFRSKSGARRRIFIVLILFIGSPILFEVALRLFEKVGISHPVTISEFRAIVDGTPPQSEANLVTYIPHPYFGYTYVPSAHLTEFNTVVNKNIFLDTNSAGFVDSEFPSQRTPGVCVYGLLGGSNALGWGVAGRENRIHAKLERLLNAKFKTRSCASYRVLNLGIGSHMQYQATHVYQYFQDLLDGVIFFGGFGECAQPAILTVSKDPVRFPILSASLSSLPNPLLLFKINTTKKSLNPIEELSQKL
jgi:hypothetical protein